MARHVSAQTEAVDGDDRRELSRRSLLRSAVAVGGAGALSAALGTEVAEASVEDTPYPRGDPSNRPERQHLWSPAGVPDQFGNPTAPGHQLVLLVDYTGDDPESDRETVEGAMRQLERAFSYDIREGLCMNVGYSPSYFWSEFGDSPSSNVVEPRAVSPHMTPELDRQDAYIHLASNQASIVLAAEEALFGDVDTVNGVDVEARLGDVFERRKRHAVFVGPGKPAENIDNPDIDEDAPLSMGFDSLFADAIPSEDRVTISNGPWADGTVAQVSKLSIDLEDWYSRDRSSRVEEMFAADYTPDEVGDVGEGLGKGSGLTREHADSVMDNARQRGIAGHGSKVARARDSSFTPKLLRRDGDITGPDGTGGLSFVGLVEDIDDWFEVAEAMYDTQVDDALRSSASATSTEGPRTVTKSGSLSGADDSAEHTYATRDDDPQGVTLSLDGPGGGDFDLYVTLDGRTPTPRDYDRRSWSYDSSESVSLGPEAVDGETTLGILVDSYSGNGEYTLDVEETRSDGGDGGSCGARVTDSVTGSVSSDGAEFSFQAGTDGPCSVTLTLDGPDDADFDLFVTLDGRTPTTLDYDRRAWSYGADEELVVHDVSSDAELGILVHPYSGSGEFELAAEEKGSGGGDGGFGDGGDGGGGGSNPTGHHQRSGIAAQMEVLARGHFLVPPRSLRALPPARP